LTAQIGSTADFADQYTYDNLGRMTGVEQSEQSGQSGGNSVAPKRVDFAYDAASQFDTITRYANLGGTQLVAQSDYDYDNASRLTALSYTKGATTLAGYTWTYDAAGRLTQFVSTADGTANYTYDDTNQLAGATYTYQSTEAYSYDANGNRANTGYSTGDGNRMTSDGTYNYQYDNEGNRTKRTNIATGAVTEYTWDYRDRLTKVTERASAEGAATKVVEYSYDVLNRRVTKDVDSNGYETFETG
jgi:YD repeat-containing protein